MAIDDVDGGHNSRGRGRDPVPNGEPQRVELERLKRELAKEKKRARIAEADAELQAKCLERIGNALGNPAVLLEGLDAWTTWVIGCLKNAPGTNKKLLAELKKKERALKKAYTALNKDLKYFQKGCVSKEEIKKLATEWQLKVAEHQKKFPHARCFSYDATKRRAEELLALIRK